MSDRIASMSDEAFGWYLTGLTDGEGCFHFRATIPRTRGSLRPQFQGTFTIATRDDDREGITAIRNRFGVGRLYADLAASRSGKGKPQVRWDVCRASEFISHVIPHFERFPLQLKKRRDFEVWKKCVVLWHASTLRNRVGKLPSDSKFGARGSRLTDQEITLLLGWIEELKAGRKYATLA